MINFYPTDMLLQLGKDKIREFHKECADIALAEAGRKYQPGRISATVSHAIRLLIPLIIKMDADSTSTEMGEFGD
jgi:hypothetical protein